MTGTGAPAMFSAFLFATDPDKLRDRLTNDPGLVPEVGRRIKCRSDSSAKEIERVCACLEAARSGGWPAAAGAPSVDAFLWLLDYAAEPITCGGLRDIRDSGRAAAVPFLREMVAAPGPLPVPDVTGVECEIGFLDAPSLRALADRGPPHRGDRFLDRIGTELAEVFESLAADNLGLYTVIDGAKLTGE